MPSIKTDMIHFLAGLQRSGKTSGVSWPALVPAVVSGQEIRNIWDSGNVMALLIIEPVNATLGSELLLDTSQVALLHNSLRTLPDPGFYLDAARSEHPPRHR